MQIISGQNVDLISPFPPGEVRRVFGWNHCYRTFTENDDTPNTIEEFARHMEVLLSLCPSWGIIDKNRLTNSSHEAPLVGIGMFEPASIRNGYFHVATARKAFRTGLIDEAGELVIKHLFDNVPTLLRLSAYMDEKNSPAKGLCRRMGFKYEGLCEDATISNGQPRNVVYFGLTRRNWQCRLDKQDKEAQVDLEILTSSPSGSAPNLEEVEPQVLEEPSVWEAPLAVESALSQ